MLDTTSSPHDTVQIDGIKTEMVRRGRGRPLLLLHPEIGFSATDPVIDTLARSYDTLVPYHPGFGHTELPPWMTTVDDLSYFYLGLLEALDLHNVVLAGIALGGWLAAEIAVKSPTRVSHLVLANPAGIKLGDREHRDMVDIFSLTPREIDVRAYHDPSHARHFDPKTSSEDEIFVELRNRESSARFAWSPYMHNPKLVSRLHLIRVPTLVLWGQSDQIAPAEYGRRYSQHIADARFELIEQAGRFSHIERPAAFAEKISDFVGG